ncbi:MAG: TA system VapC family ribonuclease toxin [Roseiarcus sp.]
MTFLLDVNVLIALVDASHVSHEAAHDWFAREGHLRWATCPITENGLVRILGNPKYPNALATPAEAMALLAQLASLPGHIFWPDDVSLRNAARFAPAKILTTGQIADSYLLALAASKGGMLATLDRHFSTLAVIDGAKSLRFIGA